MMIDLHTHILPSIDDGADSYETALEMLRIAEKDGITHIVCTPHFINGEINNSASVVTDKYKAFIKSIKADGIKLNVFYGSELFICPELPQLVEGGEVCTMNGSSYVLVELPMSSIPCYMGQVIYQLRLSGFTPVIAHPERYSEVQKNPGILYQYINQGALFQLNSSSITGLMGTRARDTAFTLLDRGMAHFVSSDAHTARRRSPRLSMAREIIREKYGEDTAAVLFETNGLNLINNHKVDIPEPRRMADRKHFHIPVIKRLMTLCLNKKT